MAEEDILTLNKILKEVDLTKHGDKPLIIFAEGKLYRGLQFIFGNNKHIEIGGGWTPIEKEDYPKYGIERS